MGKIRAIIGSSDIRTDYSSSSTPGMNLSGVKSIADVIGIYNEYNEIKQYIDAVAHILEISNLKDSLEQSIPEGEFAEVIVSGPQFGKGFNFIGLSDPGQPTIDDGTPRQRSLTIKLIGRAKYGADPSIKVELEGINNSTGIKLIPSWDKTELIRRDNERIKVRTVDNMDFKERHIYEHTDRSLA